MRTDRDVQDRDVHFVVHDVFDRGHKFARLPPDGLSRFHDDLHPRVPLHEPLQDAHELVPVVILARNVVPAAEVHPLHLVDVLAEMLLEGRKHAFQRVGVLLAQGMEVQSLNPVQEFRFEFFFGDSEPRELAARVVQVGLDRRELGVYADAGADPRLECLVLEAHPLAEAVETDMVGQRKDFVDFVVGIDGRENVDFFIHLLACKSGLVQARCGSPTKVLPDEGERPPETVPLEGAYYVNSGLFLDFVQNFHVFDESFFVQDEAWTGNLGVIEHATNIKLLPNFV